MLLSLQTADSSVPTHQYILGLSCEGPTDKLSTALQTEQCCQSWTIPIMWTQEQRLLVSNHPEETPFILFKNKKQNKFIVLLQKWWDAHSSPLLTWLSECDIAEIHLPSYKHNYFHNSFVKSITWINRGD